jgi:ribosome biogenesis GTPase
MTLADLGWDDRWATDFAPYAAQGLLPARVVCELRRKFYAVQLDEGEALAECAAGFFHEAREAAQFPAVGDWVAVARREEGGRVDLRAVLRRRTKFSRRAAGSEAIEQIVAANIDRVLLVGSLDRGVNPQRLQRFLVAAQASGAEPAIILNKADAAGDPEREADVVRALVPGVPVFVTSARTRRGLKALLSALGSGPSRTVAFIGSSGVGKSSLINALVREHALPTAEVRDKDGKGRHTTTRREVVVGPGGLLFIDTPGMRELQLWEFDEGMEQAFADILGLASRCRFGRCAHETEAGCAIREALASGLLAPERWASYRKLRAEQAAVKPRERKPGALASKPGWRRALGDGGGTGRGRITPDRE